VLLGPSSSSVDGNATINVIALDMFNNTAALHSATVQVIVSHPGTGSTLVTIRNGVSVMPVSSRVPGPVQVEFTPKSLVNDIDTSAVLVVTFVAGKRGSLVLHSSELTRRMLQVVEFATQSTYQRWQQLAKT
jgi:hypothetical protein